MHNNDKSLKASGGNCKTRGIIYAAQCQLCHTNNTYIGKSVNELHVRMNGHRYSFYETLKKYSRNKSALDIEVDNT